MSDTGKKFIRLEDLESVTGGSAGTIPPGLKPHHDGEICPECGYNKLKFIRFQEYNGIQEVYSCSYDAYILFPAEL